MSKSDVSTENDLGGKMVEGLEAESALLTGRCRSGDTRFSRRDEGGYVTPFYLTFSNGEFGHVFIKEREAKRPLRIGARWTRVILCGQAAWYYFEHNQDD